MGFDRSVLLVAKALVGASWVGSGCLLVATVVATERPRARPLPSGDDVAIHGFTEPRVVATLRLDDCDLGAVVSAAFALTCAVPQGSEIRSFVGCGAPCRRSDSETALGEVNELRRPGDGDPEAGGPVAPGDELFAVALDGSVSGCDVGTRPW